MEGNELGPDDDERRKREDAAALAHALRTPLTVIKGFAAMLASGSITKASVELPEIGERILHSAERLEALIEEALRPTDRDDDAIG